MRIQSSHCHADRGLDPYFTCREAVLSLLKLETAYLPKSIWEPAAGGGAIVTELRNAGYFVTASDIVDYGLPGCKIADYLAVKPPIGVQGIVATHRRNFPGASIGASCSAARPRNDRSVRIRHARPVNTRVAAFGASRPLPRIQAMVSFPITQPAFGRCGGNGSKCPIPAIAGRIKEPARMCRKPIFSSSAAKIPLFDLERVKGWVSRAGRPSEDCFRPKHDRHLCISAVR